MGMPRLPSESFCGPQQRFHAITLDMEAAMRWLKELAADIWYEKEAFIFCVLILDAIIYFGFKTLN